MVSKSPDVWRRVCAWCKRDLGPAGPDFTGDTHGMCETCRDTVLTQWREREGK